MNRPPHEIRFVTNAFGKPSIDGDPLAFSLSASRNLAFLVTGHAIEIGCDIEYCDPHFSYHGIVERFFSQAERAAFQTLPDDLKCAGFYRAWVCKEAYVKAVGEGLSLELDSFDVEVDPRQPARLVRGCQGYSVRSFAPEPDFQAAIVGRGDWRLSLESYRSF